MLVEVSFHKLCQGSSNCPDLICCLSSLSRLEHAKDSGRSTGSKQRSIHIGETGVSILETTTGQTYVSLHKPQVAFLRTSPASIDFIITLISDHALWLKYIVNIMRLKASIWGLQLPFVVPAFSNARYISIGHTSKLIKMFKKHLLRRHVCEEVDVSQGKEAAVAVVVLLRQVAQLPGREILAREIWRRRIWIILVPLVSYRTLLNCLQ